MDEVPLAGGSVASSVVRVGDTVRRATERSSPAVHALLVHLEAVVLAGSPRFLGLDHQGSEILTWIDGTPATKPWPAPLLTENGVRRLARLLRGYHEAVATFSPPADSEWWTGMRGLEPGEIVLHGDLGPWNTIWRDEQPVGFIDWDFAEPGSPLTDVADLAFFVTPMRDDDHCRECGFAPAPDRRQRFVAFCDSYGIDDRASVLDAVEEYWLTDIERTSRLGPLGIKPWDAFLRRALVEGCQGLLDWFRAYRHLVE